MLEKKKFIKKGRLRVIDSRKSQTNNIVFFIMRDSQSDSYSSKLIDGLISFVKTVG